MQKEVGLRTATDGEFRRASWHMDFIYSLDGVSKAPGDLAVQFHNEQGDIEFAPPSLKVDAPVHLDHTIFGDAFTFLRDNVPEGMTPKLTIPSPSMVHYRGGRACIDSDVYPDMDRFWDDLTSTYADEVRALGELGCTYLQFDDTSLAYLNDPKQREHVREIGGDAEHQHEVYIRHINEALEHRPEGMAITTHMCRGNYRSSWVAEGGYDFVAEALFNELAVLGLVTTKKPDLESKETLKRRIEEASRYVDVDQLCLSPQCGFSSTFEGNELSRDDQIAKLRLIVETAQEVWG